MRTRGAEIVALALLVGVASLAAGQQPPPVKKEPPPPEAAKPRSGAPEAPPRRSSLEEMLAQALRNNPDIQVANAKLLEAEAKLKRTRLEVAKNVVALYHSIQTQKATVKGAELAYTRKKETLQRGAMPIAVLEEAEQALTLAKAKLAELEAELPYLLGNEEPEGKTSTKTSGLVDRYLYGTTHVPAANQTVAAYGSGAKPEIRGEMAERIHKALDTPVTAKFKGATLEEVLDRLKKLAPGVLIQEKVNSSEDLHVSGDFENLPLGAVLEWLQDDLQSRAIGKVHIVVRAYGLLIVSGEMPSGAVSLRDFWKKGGSKTTDLDAAIKELQRFLKENPDGAPSAKVREMLRFLEQEQRKPKGNKEEARNPPAESVEGLVKNVDERSGLVTIDLGSEAGLSKGQTLEVYRLAPVPKYLGGIRILETTAQQAVGQPMGKMTAPLRPGDRVASRIVGGN